VISNGNSASKNISHHNKYLQYLIIISSHIFIKDESRGRDTQVKTVLWCMWNNNLTHLKGERTKQRNRKRKIRGAT